jgi:anti-sigma B factor antagonist
MDYRTRTENSITVLELSGDLDVSSAPILQTALQEIMDAGGKQVVVELSNVPFMDSSGLGVLVAAHRRMAAIGGTLALANPAPTLQKVFELTRTNRLFKVYGTVAEAVEELGTA